LGNSGGALFDARGDLVGINTAVLNRQYGGPEGIGFAIPVNLVRGVMEQILSNGRVIRGWLGFIPQDLTEDQAARVGAAVVVANVLVDSPADHVGVRPNDLLTALDGEPVRTAQDLVSRLAALTPGAEVQLEGLRGGDAFKVKMKVVERPTRSAQRQTP
jgi:serine protease DegS